MYASLLRRYARRVAGELVRGRFGPQLRSDWRNLRDLVLAPPSARATCPICGYSGVFLDHAGRRRQVCPRLLEPRPPPRAFCGPRRDGRTEQATRHRARPPLRARGLPRKNRPATCPPGHHCRPRTPRRRARPSTPATCPFPDQTFEIVLASHVLEHVLEDHLAIAEIFRVLKPGGLALLLVPVTRNQTLEFGFVDPKRNYHTRECGPDYFERYRAAGFELELIRSDQLPNARKTSPPHPRR